MQSLNKTFLEKYEKFLMRIFFENYSKKLYDSFNLEYLKKYFSIENLMIRHQIVFRQEFYCCPSITP
jgi:hypothetical protein